MKPKNSVADAFEARYVPEAITGCWLWRGAVLGSGKHTYGELRKARAHRVSWELHCGPIPDGMEVCHRCDTPLCVNPGHLFVGTHYENMQDRNRKGRTTIGRQYSSTLLSEEAVREIRASADNHRALAARYGVNYRTISQVRKRQIWQHVDGERSDNPEANLSHKGSTHPLAKLTESDIPVIRARLRNGDRRIDVARDYQVSPQLIGAIKAARIWGHVP